MVSKLACSLSYLTRRFVGHAGHFSKRSSIRGPARDTLRAVIDLVMFLRQLRQKSPGEKCTNVSYSRHYTVKLRITSVDQWTMRFSEFPIEQHFSSWWQALRYTGLLSMIYEVLTLLWTKNHGFLSIKEWNENSRNFFLTHNPSCNTKVGTWLWHGNALFTKAFGQDSRAFSFLFRYEELDNVAS